jgi:AraC-like DNA-binding protein
MDPPWSIRIQDEAPLCLTVMVRGAAWLIGDAGEPIRLGAGDVVVNRGPAPYTFADAPTTPVQVVIHPGERCATPDGRSLAEEMALGVRTWGNSAGGATTMLIGTYQLAGEVSQRLLRALPSIVVLASDAWDSPLTGLLSEEITKDEPGQEVVLDRLLDLLLIAVLRAWFARSGIDTPGWYRAYDDGVVGPVLRLLHHQPAHPWTVAELARHVGVSRAGLAARFTKLVGQPPMAFLTGWRLALAADLLVEEELTLEAVARRVGYSGAFALSTAFKKAQGVSPREYRARVRESDAPPA